MTATQLVRASAAAAVDTEAAAAHALRPREKSGQVTADHVSFTAARQHAVRLPHTAATKKPSPASRKSPCSSPPLAPDKPPASPDP